MKRVELYEKYIKEAIKEIHRTYSQEYQINQAIRKDMWNDYNDEGYFDSSFQEFIEDNAIEYEYVIDMEDDLVECEENVSYMLCCLDDVNEVAEGRCPTKEEMIKILEDDFSNKINATDYTEEIKKQLTDLFKDLMKVWLENMDKNTYMKEYMEVFND